MGNRNRPPAWTELVNQCIRLKEVVCFRQHPRRQGSQRIHGCPLSYFRKKITDEYVVPALEKTEQIHDTNTERLGRLTKLSAH